MVLNEYSFILDCIYHIIMEKERELWTLRLFPSKDDVSFNTGDRRLRFDSDTGHSVIRLYDLLPAQAAAQSRPDNRWGQLGLGCRSCSKYGCCNTVIPLFGGGPVAYTTVRRIPILGLRSTEMAFIGIWPDFVIPGMDGPLGAIYAVLRSYAATWVLIVALIAMVRRGLVQPARYAVPAKYGKAHTGEAVFVLGMICTLVLSEGLFEGSLVAAELQKGIACAVSGARHPGLDVRVLPGFEPKRNPAVAARGVLFCS